MVRASPSASISLSLCLSENKFLKNFKHYILRLADSPSPPLSFLLSFGTGENFKKDSSIRLEFR